MSVPRKPNASSDGGGATPTPETPAPAPRSPDFGLDDPFPPGYGGAARRGSGGRQRDSGSLDTASVRASRPAPAPTNRPERAEPPREPTAPREPSRRPSGAWEQSPRSSGPLPQNPAPPLSPAPRESRDPRAPYAARSVRDVREARETREPEERPAPRRPRDRDTTGRPPAGDGRTPDPYAALREAREPHTPRITDSMFDRFGWRLPEEEAAEQPPRPVRPANSAYWEEREERIRREESGQIPRITPSGPYNPYASGMFDPLAPAGDAPAFAPLDPDAPYSPYSQPFRLTPNEPDTVAPPRESANANPSLSRSGTFRTLDPAPPPAFDAPPPVGESVTRSGRFLTDRTASGSFAAIAPLGAVPVSVAPLPPMGADARAEPLPPPLVTDGIVLLFFGLTLALVGAMAAFIALRFNSLPSPIVLHFGPGGSSQPDRIGERQELWTIPFLAFIVFVANAALASVFDFFDRRDRFVPRLLLLGSTLVAAVAWIVLLTLLNKQPVTALVP